MLAQPATEGLLAPLSDVTEIYDYVSEGIARVIHLETQAAYSALPFGAPGQQRDGAVIFLLIFDALAPSLFQHASSFSKKTDAARRSGVIAHLPACPTVVSSLYIYKHIDRRGANLPQQYSGVWGNSDGR